MYFKNGGEHGIVSHGCHCQNHMEVSRNESQYVDSIVLSWLNNWQGY